MIGTLERVNFISVTKKLGGEKSSPFLLLEMNLVGQGMVRSLPH
jgi:hypothetical protein